MLSENIIQEALEAEYSQKINQYGKQRLLGTFLVGIGNYGFARTVEDLKFISVYLPNFEQLCTGYFVRDDVSVIDIRDIYYSAMNHEDISLELLFSDYMKLTPYYQETFKTKLLDNREDISHYCEKERITKAYDRAKEALEHGEIFEAYRLLISAKLYHCGTLTKKCYHIKDPIYRSYLESLLDSNSLPNEEEFHNSFKELVNGASSKISYYADSLIKTGILALMDSALKQAVTYDAFVTSLTKTETAALAYIEEILKKNQGWATIAVGKIVKDSGISRATFTNLFNKMSQSGVANVKNCGSKGTYIKIYEFC